MVSRRKVLATGASIPLVAIIGRAANAAPITMKWGDSRPPDHPGNRWAAEAAKAIREESKGRIDIQHYPSSQLGGDTDMLSQVRSGALELYTTTAPFMMSLAPAVGVSGVGFAFPTYDQVWAALDGDVGAAIKTTLAKLGIHMFDKCWDNGYRQISSSKREILGPDDLVGFKLRVAVVPIYFSMFKYMRAAPVTLNFGEVYAALQTGLVDGQENPLSLIYAGNFHEVQKTISMTNHVWDGLIITGNLRFWNSLEEADRKLIAHHIDAAGLKQREDIKSLNDKLRAQLSEKGIKFNDVDPKAFQAALKKTEYYTEWKGKIGEQAWTALERYAGKLG